MGANGSGKSTLLRVLSRVYTPTNGKISINGKINSLININSGMNYEMSGIDNIKIKCLLHGIRLNDINSKSLQIIEFSELGDYIYMPIKTYSSGMLMRLSFAILTSFDSEIIIMDEWLSVGDSSFKEKANKRLAEMLSKDSIFIIATHSDLTANSMCNKKIYLEGGRIHQ